MTEIHQHLVDLLLSAGNAWVIVGLVVIIALHQFNRMAGGCLGLVFSGLLLIWGRAVYVRRGAVALAGFELSELGFYLVAAAVSLSQIVIVLSELHAIGNRRRMRQARAKVNRM